MRSDWVTGLLAAFVLLFSLPGFAGGEVPWPISKQSPVTSENSKGLWYVSSERGSYYYNVEILDTYDGFSWMRVSEIDIFTSEIIRYGEGFYCQDSHGNIASSDDSDIESINFEDTYVPQQFKYGRYMYMFPESDTSKLPYLLRVVEVETDLGMALGMSIYPRKKGEETVHALGYKLNKEPLACDYINEKLECDMSPLSNAISKK